MTAISTGYTNAYSNTAAVTSSPANFGAGQITKSDDKDLAEEAAEKARKSAGYVTETRGSRLNISA